MPMRSVTAWGVNHHQIPVNAPKCPFANNQRDGAMQLGGAKVKGPNYEPNSFNGPKQCPAFSEPPLRIDGDADRYDHREGNDDFTQAGDLFRLMPSDAQERLFGNIGRSMAGVPEEIVVRQLCHFFRADPAYGMGVAKALCFPMEKLEAYMPKR